MHEPSVNLCEAVERASKAGLLVVRLVRVEDAFLGRLVIRRSHLGEHFCRFGFAAGLNELIEAPLKRAHSRLGRAVGAGFTLRASDSFLR